MSLHFCKKLSQRQTVLFPVSGANAESTKSRHNLVIALYHSILCSRIENVSTARPADSILVGMHLQQASPFIDTKFLLALFFIEFIVDVHFIFQEHLVESILGIEVDMSYQILFLCFVFSNVTWPQRQGVVWTHGHCPTSCHLYSICLVRSFAECSVVVEGYIKVTHCRFAFAFQNQSLALHQLQVYLVFIHLDQLFDVCLVNMEEFTDEFLKFKEQPVFIECRHILLSSLIDVVATCPVEFSCKIKHQPCLQHLTVALLALQHWAIHVQMCWR